LKTRLTIRLFLEPVDLSRALKYWNSQSSCGYEDMMDSISSSLHGYRQNLILRYSS